MTCEDEEAMTEEDALEAERAFRDGFAQTRGSEYEIRPTAKQFVQRVNAKASQGDDGGAGRTKYAPPIKELSPKREMIYAPVDDAAAEPSAQSDHSTLAVFKALLEGAKRNTRDTEPVEGLSGVLSNIMAREKLQLKAQ